MLTVYGDSDSGNCRKIRYVADYLGLAYDWVETSVMAGDTRTEAFRRLNPAGQVPFVMLEDGRPLSQSAAIMLHLAEGSALIPADGYARALMYQFLFWEQYSHETAIAVRRYHKHMRKVAEEDLDPGLLPKGHRALALMEDHLSQHQYFAGGSLSLADVALVAYTRLAPEGGFDLAGYPAVRHWIAKVEAGLDIGEG